MTDLAAPTAPATPAAVPASPTTPAAPAQGLTSVAPAEPTASPSASPAAGVTTAPASTPEPAAPARFAPLHDHPSSQKADEERAAKEAAKREIHDKKPIEEAKPAEAEKPIEGEILPLDFQMPATLKAAPEQIQEFGALVQAAKADAKASGQRLLEMHAKAMEAYGKQIVDNQWNVWNDFIATKDKEILADPILGGAGHDEVKATVLRTRDLLVPEARRASFSNFMNSTGAGSWPDFWHLLYAAAQIFGTQKQAAGGKPAGDTRIQQPAGRFGLMHDHPSSQRAK